MFASEAIHAQKNTPMLEYGKLYIVHESQGDKFLCFYGEDPQSGMLMFKHVHFTKDCQLKFSPTNDTVYIDKTSITDHNIEICYDLISSYAASAMDYHSNDDLRYESENRMGMWIAFLYNFIIFTIGAAFILKSVTLTIILSMITIANIVLIKKNHTKMKTYKNICSNISNRFLSYVNDYAHKKNVYIETTT